MDRRSLLTAALAGLLGTRLLPLRRRARRWPRSPPRPSASTPSSPAPAPPPAEPYARPLMKMAPPFADLKYDQFRAIRFRDDRRLFADGSRGFQMELLPPGFHFQDRIEINLVAADGRVQPVAFSTDYFDFHPDYFPFPDGRAPAGLADDMGFSRHPLPPPDQPPRGLGRVRGVPGRELLPRRRPRHALRPLGPRPRHRHRAAPTPRSSRSSRAFWVHEPQPGDRGAAPAGAARQRLRSPAPSTSASSPAPRR